MHDRNVGLDTRIEAARFALRLTYSPPNARVDPDLIIRVSPLAVNDGPI
jgi:hypothetical protein